MVSFTSVWCIWELVSGIYNCISCFQRCSLCWEVLNISMGVFKWVFEMFNGFGWCLFGVFNEFGRFSMSLWGIQWVFWMFNGFGRFLVSFWGIHWAFGMFNGFGRFVMSVGGVQFSLGAQFFLGVQLFGVLIFLGVWFKGV